jgi:hypothetical protein
VINHAISCSRYNIYTLFRRSWSIAPRQSHDILLPTPYTLYVSFKQKRLFLGFHLISESYTVLLLKNSTNRMNFWLIIFNYNQWKELIVKNCSKRTREEWYRDGNQNIPIGFLYASLGFVFVVSTVLSRYSNTPGVSLYRGSTVIKSVNT